MSTGVFRKATRLFGATPELVSKPKVKSVAAVKPVMSYHAVTVVVGDRACAAARAIEQKRFLSREAPKLPLKNCDYPNCQCHYAHHDDRRRGPRRAREMGVALDGYEGDEKRGNGKARGRRKTDR